MSFTSPLWLLLLILAPLVILLHALSIRWRSTPVSSLVFWNEVLKERKASVRIRRLLTSLVLLLQVLAVIALALALAGPVAPGLGGSARADVILVLDATASMQAREGSRTRFDVARERGLGLAAGLRGGARMAVVLAEKSPRLLSGFTGDKAALRRLIRGAAATDEPGDVAAAVVFALSLRDPRRGGQVVLETDGAFDELPGVDTTVPWIRVELVGTARDNVGITGMSFRRSSAGDSAYEFFLSVRNAGRTLVSVPLSVRAAGKEVISRTLVLGAGQRRTVTAPWTGPITGRVEAILQTGDAFPTDDRAFAVFTPARRVQVLVVGTRPWFIQKALTSLPGVTVRVQDEPSANAPTDDVTVYAGVQPPPLEKGNYILFAASPPNLPLRVRGVQQLPPVTGWSRTDPLLDSVSLAGVTIGQALDLDPGPGFSVLAASGTSPLLLSWDHAGVKALLAAFDPRASDFPLRPGFPIFLANVLSWFFPTWLEPQADQVQAGDARGIPSVDAEGITVVKPDGRSVHLAAVGPSASFLDTAEVGFYTAESGGTSTEFAVNLFSDAETDISPRFAAPRTQPGGPGGKRGEAAQVWAAFATAALVLIFLEWLAWVVRALRKVERPTPRRAAVFLLLRSAAVLLLILGLAGFALTRFSDRLSLVFLLDQSHSVPVEAREKALRVIEAIRSRLGRGDSAVLVRFGSNAETETLEPGVTVAEEGGSVDPGATNIGAALQDGLAQAGSGQTSGGQTSGVTAPRIVLLTDGNENRGSADAAAAVAKSMGARIFPVPLQAPASGAEVSVEEVRAPERVRQAEAHEVTVMVQSRTAVSAHVTLLRDAVPVAARVEQLAPGENAVQFTGSFHEKGLHAWDALVEAPGDGIPQNNHNRRLVDVSGPPQVLYVSRPGRSSPSLLAALSAQGISVVARPATALPGTLAGYLPYDALILDNVPGYGISTEKMETIARYVRDTGGGLLMAGGDSSFGAGGYYKTPIERVLPVDMDAKSQVQVPGLSLLLVVDKSGSMGGTVPSGETKLDVVKSAALAAIETLNPFDKAGVIAFDADWVWAVPMTDANDTARITTDLATLTPGGGTIMYPALEEADRVLSASGSPLRHVILLTDGLTETADFQKLLVRMGQHHITVSTVAIGDDADTGMLAAIARWGNGRTYATSDPREVPRIFLTDTTLAGRGLLVEKSFLPREASAAEMMRGLSLASIPGLHGFVLTYMKNGAEQVLSALYDSPLLAAWRYGLGRTAAFTSDFNGRWSASLLAWDQFPRFAAQLVRWIERPMDSNVLHPSIQAGSGIARLTIDADDSAGAFVDGLEIEGILIRPGGERVEMRIPQSGPGRYETTFPADEAGDYTVTLSAHSGETELAPVTIGTSIAWSEEYRMPGVNATLLDRLAASTGGRLIQSGDDQQGLSALLHREPGASGAGSDAARFLLVVSLLLFFLDIAARRLAAPRELLGRITAPLRALLSRPARRGLSYEDLTAMVALAREEERSKMKTRITGLAREGKLDPDLAAYLYIARLRSGRAAKEREKEE